MAVPVRERSLSSSPRGQPGTAPAPLAQRSQRPMPATSSVFFSRNILAVFPNWQALVARICCKLLQPIEWPIAPFVAAVRSVLVPFIAMPLLLQPRRAFEKNHLAFHTLPTRCPAVFHGNPVDRPGGSGGGLSKSGETRCAASQMVGLNKEVSLNHGPQHA